ncbi:hypothetical protein RND71_038146 [Anisodus tanguticus]|uniref:Uncharacterized protein n=1 Tax=Anisodus tanguticus TaxID=243964 RepID=A0AAE1QZ55_9SOLA|nr:hypothetical protein RND71_038146 [Anisodus tanguticus]
MYPASFLLGQDKDESVALPVDELIEKSAGVFPGKSTNIKLCDVKIESTYVGVNIAPALKKADIGIDVAYVTNLIKSSRNLA